MTSALTHEAYLRLLEPWARGAARHLYSLPGRPDQLCYGIGNHGHWALQANTTAFTGFGLLGMDPDSRPEASGMSREQLRDTALGLLRFTLAAHHSGGGSATDGETWGHSWISALCLERMMHGIEALEPLLTDRDREALRRLLLSEADWLLDNYTIVAGLVDNNKPESNMWNGALLHRVLRLYPGAPRADEYLEKGTGFLLNAISIPADSVSAAIIGGKALREWHVGANFFDSYACNHHHYLNIGYIIITLSNAAMLHFSCKRHGWTAPEALYHHVAELWPLVKTCTFPDGRLLRIGGDTRVRYCYCQDYAIPVWLMMADHFGETECSGFEAGWLAQVAREQAGNADGACLGTRLRPLEEMSPLYYTRLEGDKAASLSMGAAFRRLLQQAPAAAAVPRPSSVPLLGAWGDEYHGACLVRSPRRIASWVWEAAEKPQGLCLPPAESSMAEWRHNMAGSVTGLGLVNEPRVVHHVEHPFAGGFATLGQTCVRTRSHIAEGEFDQDIAVVDLAFAALPDDATVVGIQRARTPARVVLRGVKGLYLQIANDLFNGSCRSYSAAGGSWTLGSCPGETETLSAGGCWLNIDDRLGVLALGGGDTLQIHRPAQRQITVRSHGWMQYCGRPGGSLYADEICLGACCGEVRHYTAGETLFDLAFAVRAGVSSAQTRSWAETEAERAGGLLSPIPDVRMVQAAGADGRDYLVVANFACTAAAVQLPGRRWRDCASGRILGSLEGASLTLPPRDVQVLAAEA